MIAQGESAIQQNVEKMFPEIIDQSVRMEIIGDQSKYVRLNRIIDVYAEDEQCTRGARSIISSSLNVRASFSIVRRGRSPRARMNNIVQYRQQ